MLKSVISQYYSKLISLPVLIFIHGLLVRKMTPDDFARYSYLLAVATVLTSLVDLGVGNFYYREMLASQTKSVGRIIRFRCLLLAIVVLLGYCLSFFWPEKLQSLNLSEHGSVFALVFLVSLHNSLELGIQATSAFSWLAHGGVVVNFIALGFYCFAGQLSTLGLTGAILLYVTWQALRATVYLYLYLKRRPILTGQQSIQLNINKLLPWILVYVLGAGYSRLDHLMLNWLGSSYDLSTYAAAYGLYEKCEFFILSITIVLYNFFTKHENQRVFEQLLTILNVVSLTFVVLAVLLAKDFIGLIVGNHYPESRGIFYAMTLGMASAYYVSFLVNTLLVRRLDWVQPIGLGVGLAVNAVSNFFVIPKFGAIGATYATVAAQLAYAVVTLIYFKRAGHWKMPKVSQAIMFFPFVLILLPIEISIICGLVALAGALVFYRQQLKSLMTVLAE